MKLLRTAVSCCLDLSLIYILYRLARPHVALLDEVDAAGAMVYRGVDDNETELTELTEPGLIVYRFDAPLVFANAPFFSDFDSTAADALDNLDVDLERSAPAHTGDEADGAAWRSAYLSLRACRSGSLSSTIWRC